MGEKHELKVINPDERVKSELLNWLREFKPNANFRELRDSINRLRHAFMYGLIEKEMYTALVYGIQVETVILRESLIEGGGTQLTDAAKSKATFARMSDQELKDYLAQSNSVKRIEMINDLDRRGQIVDAEVVEVPKIKIKVSTPKNVSKRIQEVAPKTGLLAQPLPAPPPPKEENDECPI